ncbi:MAG: hypothetical protein JSV51_09500 [Candidatus Bathyarchaeota archaeon]|nr:MAG: hypothetical protein JSV51_09500 [Candidatus Bathyarchaeota archaeon]UCH31997.1 MAG: hypothetical protein JSV05_00970 [Candidatus Bathyarchaeota archaeon]
MRKQKTSKRSLNRKLLFSTLLVTLFLVFVLIALFAFFLPQTEDWTAAIVDQLTIEVEVNQEFNSTISSLLNASGFDVHYYPGADVTVDFYKSLPSKGSKIIILRAHSAVRNNTDFVDLFTSELYSESKRDFYSAKYGNQLSRARFLIPPFNDYFAVGPTFIESSMKGTFSDCIIILMGCESLNKTSMAEALVNRGAKAVLGWTDWILLDDTDNSTIQLLRYLLAQNPFTLQSAVAEINKLSHPYGAKLEFYPKTDQIRNYKIPTRKDVTSLSLLNNSLQRILLVPLIKGELADQIVFKSKLKTQYP